MDAEAPPPTPPPVGTGSTVTTPAGAGAGATVRPPEKKPLAKRFHGSVKLDSARVGRDASLVADEVIAHLAGLVGAKVTVILEIQAEIPSGAPENVVRTVTENGRSLKFTNQGFETE
jgi:hypothetical protein